MAVFERRGLPPLTSKTRASTDEKQDEAKADELIIRASRGSGFPISVRVWPACFGKSTPLFDAGKILCILSD